MIINNKISSGINNYINTSSHALLKLIEEHFTATKLANKIKILRSSSDLCLPVSAVWWNTHVLFIGRSGTSIRVVTLIIPPIKE